MTTTYLGGLTLGEVMPGVRVPLLTAMADLQARIDAMLAFVPTVSVDFSQMLQVSAQIGASIEAAIAIGLQPPSLTAQVQIMADLNAALILQLKLIAALVDLFGVPSIHAWAYNGRADQLGSGMSAELSGGLPGGAGPAEAINALVIATGAAATWNAIGQVLKVTP